MTRLTIEAQSNGGHHWRALVTEGKQVRLLARGGGYWVVFECETEAIAEHIVRMLQEWSKSAHEQE